MASAWVGVGLVLAGAGAAVGARAIYDRGRRRSASRRWLAAMNDSALVVAGTGAFPSAAGQQSTRAIEAWVDELTEDGRTRQFVRIRVRLDDGCPEVFARRRKPTDRGLSWPEIKTGDRSFDEAIRVHARDPLGVAAWLDEPRRAALRRLDNSGLGWSVGNGFVGLSHPEVPASPDVFREWLVAMVGAADDLARAPA